MTSEQYKKIFDLLSALQQNTHKPLPQRLVDTLVQFFNGYTVVLFEGPSYELFIQNPENRIHAISTLLYQPVFSNAKESAINQYRDRHSQSDPFQPVNMPSSLKGKNIVCYSDMNDPTMIRNGQFDRFLSDNSLSTRANIYLYQEDICIAIIAICCRGEQKAFPQEERELFELIGKAIAPLYQSYLYESYYASVADIYRTYYEPNDIGLALVTARAELIEANPTAEKFGRQLVKYLSEQKESSLTQEESGPPLSRITRMLILTQKTISSSIERTLVFDGVRFYCILKPCMLTRLSTDLRTLYVLRITKEAVSTDSISSSAVKQYQLTNREKEIANLLISGYNTSQISQTLFISHNTVKNHISNIFRKMEVSSRIELLSKLNEAKDF